MPRLSFKDWFLRKLRYYKTFAELKGIEGVMVKWGGILDWIRLSASYNLVYRFLLNLYLQMNLGFDFKVTDFWNIDTQKEGYPEYQPVPKAIYGQTKYNEGVYDPDDVTSKELEEAIWELREKATEGDYNEYKLKGIPLILHIEHIKSIFKKRNVKDLYLDAIEDTLALVEGKIVNASYVGIAVVGIAKVSKPRTSVSKFKMRMPRNWIQEIEMDSIKIYETHVGMARVGYCRVSSKEPDMRPELINRLVQEVDAFHKRIDTLWQHTFFLQRHEKFMLKGAQHQIHLQEIINTTKRILDKYGVVAQMRLTYCLFAQELCYHHYKGHRKTKHYKRLLTEDEIIEKYVKLGCDRQILEAIRNALRAYIY